MHGSAFQWHLLQRPIATVHFTRFWHEKNKVSWCDIIPALSNVISAFYGYLKVQNCYNDMSLCGEVISHWKSAPKFTIVHEANRDSIARLKENDKHQLTYSKMLEVPLMFSAIFFQQDFQALKCEFKWIWVSHSLRAVPDLVSRSVSDESFGLFTINSTTVNIILVQNNMSEQYCQHF